MSGWCQASGAVTKLPMRCPSPLLLCLVVLGGCVSRPLADPDGDAGLATAAIVVPRDDAGTPMADPPRLPRVGRLHDVLVLSGGGSDGAFGAGVLVGWSRAGTRPQFDVVTGVSTGALIGVLAFAGADWDPVLERAYTSVTRKQIYRKRGLFGLLKRGAIYDRKPLETLIDSIVDQALLDRVAKAHRDGRRLYVATTDLDRGTQVTWDLGAIAAAASPARAALFKRVLLASAAVPGAFAPVYIRERAAQPTMHVDGGVKTAVLLRGFMIDAPTERQRVWTIINGHLSWRGAEAASGPGAGSIVSRSVSELLRTVTALSVFDAYVISRRVGAEFRVAWLPDQEPELNPVDFDPAGMKRLFDVGASLAARGAWATEPPRLGRYERLN